MNTRYTNMNSFTPCHNTSERKCPVCGKMFQPAPEHSYSIGKNRKRLVCSYSCMRKWEKGETKKLFTKDKKHKRYVAVRIVETGETFKSIKECADYLNAAPSGVRKALKTGIRCRGFYIEEIKEGEKI